MLQYKFRRTRLPLLSHFLLTSDNIPSDDSTPPPASANPLSLPARAHPPPLYYLPAILTPAQESFIDRRKAEASRFSPFLNLLLLNSDPIQVHEAAEKEWQLFREERETGIGEINQLRQRVAEEEARRKTEKISDKDEMDTDSAPGPPAASEDASTTEAPAPAATATEPSSTREAEMDVDDTTREAREEHKEPAPEPEKKDEPAPMQADDDDAVEY